jgi:hypothetical protein
MPIPTPESPASIRWRVVLDVKARPATPPHRQPTPLACILYVGSELPEGAADTGRRTVRGRHFVSFMLH